MRNNRIAVALFFVSTLLLLCLGPTLLLQVATGSSMLEPTPTPTPMLTPHTSSPTPTAPDIRIAREEYERALALWRSQGIDEYEVVYGLSAYSRMAGTYRFIVRDNGDLDLKEYDPSYPNPDAGHITPIPTEYWRQRLSGFTVDSAFRRAEPGSAYCLVSFDPVLGYPSEIDCKNPPNIYLMHRTITC